jgi:hypothetical protein
MEGLKKPRWARLEGEDKVTVWGYLTVYISSIL